MTQAPITFVVPGFPSATRQSATALPDAAERGTLKASARVVPAQRAGATTTTVSATPGEDVVLLTLQNGPVLVLHPAHARDLFRSQAGAADTRGGTGAAAPDRVDVPAHLRWRGAQPGAVTRSRLGDIALAGIDIVKDAASQFASDFIVGKGQQLVASALVDAVDRQVHEGVYLLEPSQLPALKDSGTRLETVPGGPGRLLVFVHGTFSTTKGTFAKLWTQHPQLVARLFDHYQQRVYALDHRTLSVSPIQNAFALAQALPRGTRLHLVTHSRGGLVGEVLARAGALDPAVPLDFDPAAVHAEDRRTLAELARVLAANDIQVERLVRVACPARGTLLASRRLDAYLSVLRWALTLAGLPVASAVVDFLYGVAQHRADPERIPGLAAQVPDSALLRWLHAMPGPIEGDLRVVAGDIEGDTIGSWLKTLLADSFFWTDNDLVVQTRSMYGGSPRNRSRATFVLDRGAAVSHFQYFGNARTADAIVGGLVEAAPAGFETIGPLSYAGQNASGTRAARAAAARADRPAVILVPGLFGSQLTARGTHVWPDAAVGTPVDHLRIDGDPLEVEGLVESQYGELARFLAASHDVVEGAYDWRRPLLESAAALAAQLEQALKVRRDSGLPVRLIAHSTGSLVVRALQLEHDALWQEWLAHEGARLVLLGPTDAGCWLPMQLLTGDETLGGRLVFASTPGGERRARQVFADCPGVIQLQAGLTDATTGLERAERWQELARQDVDRVIGASAWHDAAALREIVDWGLPSQQTLDAAMEVQRRLAAQRDRLWASLGPRTAVVLGRGTATPIGFEVTPDGLRYRCTTGGDGCAADDEAAVHGAQAWRVEAGHGDLPSHQPSFEALRELIERGTTDRLPTVVLGPTRGDRREAEAAILMRPSRQPGAVVPATSTHLSFDAGASTASIEDDAGEPVHVTVANGDLTFVRAPLLIGHYRSSLLTGAERVADVLIGGTMAASLTKGQYPDAPGSHQVFVNTRVRADDPTQTPRPEAVIVVGLGPEGQLKPVDLVQTVRHGVLAWSQRLRERAEPPAAFEIASALIGSGGIGMSVGQSAQLIVQGVREANALLTGGLDGDGPDPDGDRPWPRVSHVRLIELYRDRATEAWQSLRMTADVTRGTCVLADGLTSLPGALPRPIHASYRGADYDFIRAETIGGEQNPGIGYTLDTRRARSETHPQPVQLPLIRSLIDAGATDQNRDERIGRTLFRLLVPTEMEPFLTGTTDAQLEVDAGTAGIPWELLDARDHRSRDTRPWAIRTKLIRKLRTTDFRARVSDADFDAQALVIGDPASGDEGKYPRLPGAREEARHVALALTTGPRALPEPLVRTLVSPELDRPGPDARTVINTLIDGEWRILHIAGHGDLGRGVVLSGAFIGEREIRSMRTVPELVFVNCCHLAGRDAAAVLAPERPAFASSVADMLIKIGVRCVLAAGWAVEDRAAFVFAQQFYQAVLGRRRFIDAVAQAREAAWRLGGNTWGAYQCYGDPDWTLQRRGDGTSAGAGPAPDRFVGIASAFDLEIALQTIAVECKYQDRKRGQPEIIRRLEDRFDRRWGDTGRVAEAFAVAWAEAGNRHRAQAWYRRALAANDGGATMRAAEQLANLQARLAWDDVARSAAASTPPTGTGRARRARRAAVDPTVVRKARAAVAGAIRTLDRLVALQPTIERHSLLGSARKRQAMMARLAGDSRQAAASLRGMQRHYEAAETLARAQKSDEFYYPALNRLAARLALDGGPEPVPLDERALAEIRANLDARVKAAPDFWNVVSQIDLAFYEAVADRRLSTALPDLRRAYEDLHLRVGATWLWSSVLDQARFVLDGYGSSGAPAERRAADQLLAYLRTNTGD